MRFYVTQQDIDNAVDQLRQDKMKTKCCPIAQSVNRTVKAKWISVGISDISLVPDNHTEMNIYRLPLKARQFINDFDNGREVKPFYFSVKGITP